MYCVMRASVPSLHNVYRRYDRRGTWQLYTVYRRGTWLHLELQYIYIGGGDVTHLIEGISESL